MSITPAGSPAWTRTAGHTDYGGHINKRNYLSVGVINAMTDVGAEQICRLAADTAAMALTAPFAIITYLCNDSVPAAPTIECVYLMTGVYLVSYAGGSPPTGFPSAARNGNGNVTFTFASSYNDEYGVAGSYTPRHAEATGHHASSHRAAVCTLSGQTVQVRVFDDAGTAASNPRVTLVVT